MTLPMINFTNPYAVLVALILFILVLFLAKETKKSLVMGLMLGVFLIMVVCHTVEFITMQTMEDVRQEISRTITYDLIFIFLTFITYLWIDDIESKLNKKKSIDNSLEWFWKKV